MRHHELTMQAVYAKTLGELIEADPNVLCLEADLAKASGTIPHISDKLPRPLHRRGRFGGEHDQSRRGPGRRGQNPLLLQFHLLCHSPRLRSDHHQRGLSEQQREDRRHRARHHARLERRHAHVLPRPGHHAGDAEHARLFARRRLRVAGDHASHGRHEAADLFAGDPLPNARHFRQRLRVRSQRGQDAAAGRGRDAGHDRLHAAVRA